MGISNLTEKHLKSAKQSAVSDHLLECSLDFDNFDILSSDTNKFMLLLNIETDNKHIGIEQYQFSNTFISFTLIISSISDDALLVRVKRQNFKRKKHGLVKWICI